MAHKKQLLTILALGAVIVIACLGVVRWYKGYLSLWHRKPIRVGILHSLTGTMAFSEKNVIDITTMALEELNAAGGLMGQPIEFIIADGQSNEKIFAREAERLITQEQVVAIFGCWTSASRKAVVPIIEKYHHILFYPVQYEGIEESASVIYLGSTPNQTAIPATTWCFKNLGTKFFLVGSDYIFPRILHKILKLHITSLGGEVVGETFIKLGSPVVAEVTEQIAQSQATVILNSINGDSNLSFFKELRKASITSEKIPVMSFSISEPEIIAFDVESIIGSYAVWTYLQSLDTPYNKKLIESFQQKYGPNKTINDAMANAYAAVQLWSLAVKKGRTTNPKQILEIIKTIEYNGPSGVVFVDTNNHSWRQTLIGKVEYNGQFNTIWSSQRTIRALIYPPYLTKQDWDKFLFELYDNWGRQWSAD